jgi:protein-S-isoprenylcysteine O-methyltransferase Ste14
MFVAVRAVIYSSLFIAVVLIWAPARLLSRAGIARPAAMGAQQIVGMAIGAAGAGFALWCIVTFASMGKGTPAPFDPPRRLVSRGPYRFVRNPMYLGAALALAGAAIFYGSLALVAYAGGFLLAMHLFVVAYEEPALRQTFGQEYEAYCRRVRRWWPTVCRS